MPKKFRETHQLILTDEMNVQKFTLNSNTATKIIDQTDNGHSISYAIFTTTSSQGVWIRFKPAAADNNKDGIFIDKNNPHEMKHVVYTGEVSAIADSGNNVPLSVTWI